jgi:hypothetical protein
VWYTRNMEERDENIDILKRENDGANIIYFSMSY